MSTMKQTDHRNASEPSQEKCTSIDLNSQSKLNPLLLFGQDKGFVFITITCKGGDDGHATSSSNKSSLEGTNAATICRILPKGEDASTVNDHESVEGVGEVLYISGLQHHLTLPLYGEIDINQCTFKQMEDGVTTCAILKKSMPRSWPRLAKSSQKLHFIRIDWSKWVDADDDEDEENEEHDAESDEFYRMMESQNPSSQQSLSHQNIKSPLINQLSSQHQSAPDTLTPTRVTIGDGSVRSIPPLLPFGDGSSTAIPIEASDCRDLSNDLVPSLFDGQNIEIYWKNQLTTPQRLHTLTRMWNVIPVDERPAVLRTLVQLISQIDERLASHVKGGQEVLRDLLYDEYSYRHISYSHQMVQQLSDIHDEQQRLTVLKSLFSLTSIFERQIVCSTFL